MRTFWGCGYVEQGKWTSMEVGSGGRKGNGDHGRAEDNRYDHLRGKVGVQADATKRSNVCWWRAHDWQGTTMEGHGYGRGDGRHPLVQASIGCVEHRQQSLAAGDPPGKAVENWDAQDQQCWEEEAGVGWNHRCASHLWVGPGWHCCPGGVEGDRSGQEVEQQCLRKRSGARPGDLAPREAEHLLLVPASVTPSVE